MPFFFIIKKCPFDKSEIHLIFNYQLIYYQVLAARVVLLLLFWMVLELYFFNVQKVNYSENDNRDQVTMYTSKTNNVVFLFILC